MKSVTYRNIAGMTLVGAALGLLGGCAAKPTETQPVCGDRIVEGDEECDNGTDWNNDFLADACRTNCRRPHCGDSTVDTGEECDDGNTTSNDGCSATCVHERICGDGVMEGTEECDDGNNEPGDGCSPGCFLTYT
ncbi:MAG: DUF4215 domain-containing protein, partial [bacterium]